MNNSTNGRHNNPVRRTPLRVSAASAGHTAPQSASKKRSEGNTAVSVYLARYILFLIIYLALMTVCVLTVRAFLHATTGSDSVIQFTEPQIQQRMAASDAMAAVDEEDYTQSVINNLTFKLDLSAYEQYMNPSDRDSYITLINQTHPLGGTYKPDDLTDVSYVRSGVETPYLRLIAAKALEAMLMEAYAEGCTTTLTVTSCYRSYEYQQSLFDYRVSVYSYLSDEEARAKAATIVAIPGQSEHQFGLSADIHSLVSADVSFEDTFEADWLKENSWKFGFILRYPIEKIDITGISFEPWHFRYVGRYHAFKIYESGLCLEEYCEKTGLGLELAVS